MSNGFLSIKYHLKQDAQKQTPAPKKLTAGTYGYFVRGKNFKPQEVYILECVLGYMLQVKFIFRLNVFQPRSFFLT